MLALIAVALGLLAGLVSGGRARNLANLGFRRPGWLAAGFAALVALQTGPGSWRRGAAQAVLLGASYAFLLVFLWENRRRRPLWLAAAGVVLNLSVIVPNGGMPVSAHAVEVAGLPDPRENTSLLGGKHRVAGPDTVLRPLGDVIPVPLPGARQAISPGDILVLGAIGWLVAATVRRTLPGVDAHPSA